MLVLGISQTMHMISGITMDITRLLSSLWDRGTSLRGYEKVLWELAAAAEQCPSPLPYAEVTNSMSNRGNRG